MPPAVDLVTRLAPDPRSLRATRSRIEKELEGKPIKLKFDTRTVRPALGKITGQVSEFTKSLEAANARVVAFGASAGSIFVVQRAFRELIKTTVEVEKSLADINVILNASTTNLKAFGASLFDISRNTAQGFKTAAEAATEFSRQGLGLSETLKRTNDALVLTRLSGLSVADSVSSVTAAINSFNKTALNSTQIINKLANVDAAFAVSSADLAEALKRVGSTAQDAGVSFDELLALVTSVQETTAQGGAIIGNAFKTIFTRIQRPATLNQLERLGIAVRDVSGASLDADKILLNTARAFNSLGEAGKNQVVQLSAGVFQANRFRAVLSDLAKENSVFERALQTSNSTTDEAIARNERLNNTLSAQLNIARQNLAQFAAQVGEITFAPGLRSGLEVFNNLLGGFNSEEAGFEIGKGLLKGIGNFLSGPGVALLGAAGLKLFARFAVFVAQIGKDLVRINGLTSQRAQAQEAVLAVVSSEAGLQEKILSGKGRQLNVEQQILAALKAQAIESAKISAFSAGVARTAVSQGFRFGGGRTTFVPNNAGPVTAAINREIAAGVPPSTIRVGSNPALRSNRNPSGIGVFNTIDEPRGLSQGIARARAQGQNPKTAGAVPNFAPQGFGLDVESIALLEKFKSTLSDATEVTKEQSMEQKRQTDLSTKDRRARESVGFGESQRRARAAGVGMFDFSRDPALMSAAQRRVPIAPPRTPIPAPQAPRRGIRPGLGNAALGAAFAAPLLAGITSGTGPQSLGERRGGAIAQGAGDIAGFAAAGSLIAPGIGTALGALVGGIAAANRVTKQWSNDLPELEAALEKTREKTTRRTESLQQLLNLSEKARSASLSGSDRAAILQQQRNVLASGGFSAQEQLRLARAREIGGDEALREEQRRIQTEGAALQSAQTTAVNAAALRNQIRGGIFGGTFNRADFRELVGGAAGAAGSGGFSAQAIAALSGSRSGGLARGTFTAENLRRVVNPTRRTVNTGSRFGGPGSVAVDSLNTPEFRAQTAQAVRNLFAGSGQVAQGQAIGDLLESIPAQEFAAAFEELVELFGPDTRNAIDEVTESLKRGNEAQRETQKVNLFNLRQFEQIARTARAGIADAALAAPFATRGATSGIRNQAALAGIRGRGAINRLNDPLARSDAQFDLRRELETFRLQERRAGIGGRLAESFTGFGQGSISALLKNSQATGNVELLREIQTLSGGIQALAEESRAGTLDFTQAAQDIEFEIARLNATQGIDADIQEKIVGELQTLRNQSVAAALETKQVSMEANNKLAQLNEEQRETTKTIKAEAQRRATFDVGRFLRNQREEAGRAEGRASFFTDQFATGRIGAAERNQAIQQRNRLRRRAGRTSVGEEFGQSFRAIGQEFDFGRVDFFDSIEDGARSTAQSIRSEFANAFAGIAIDGEDLGDSFRQLGLNIASTVTQITARIGTDLLFGSIFGSQGGLQGLFGGGGGGLRGFNKGGPVKGFTDGGIVTGGSGVRDDVPARLQSGEFVLRKSAVNAIGRKNLEAINRTEGTDVLLNNAFQFNDARSPTAGRFNVDPRLSAFGQTEDINRQNTRKFQREQTLIQFLNDKAQFEQTRRNALKEFEKQKRNRFFGSLINAGIGVLGGAIGQFGGAGAPAGTRTTANASFAPDAFTKSGFKSPFSFQKGGAVFGGQSRVDNVPAFLTGGEFVVRKSAVDRLGLDFFEKLNRGAIKRGDLPKFQRGGPVAAPTSQSAGISEGGSMGDMMTALLQETRAVRESIEAGNERIIRLKTGQGGVEGRGAASSAPVVNIDMNISMERGGDVRATTNTVSENGNEQERNQQEREQSQRFGEQLEAAVVGVIIREQRPGGLLFEDKERFA